MYWFATRSSYQLIDFLQSYIWQSPSWIIVYRSVFVVLRVFWRKWWEAATKSKDAERCIWEHGVERLSRGDVCSWTRSRFRSVSFNTLSFIVMFIIGSFSVHVMFLIIKWRWTLATSKDTRLHEQVIEL